MKRLFLLVNAVILAVGYCGLPLTLRLYFGRGGEMVWFAGWLQSGGWPVILLPLAVNYLARRRERTPSGSVKVIRLRPKLFAAAMAIGMITGADNFMYAYGISKLPVSTVALIDATQLAFTVVFSFFIVKQKLTAFSVNAVVLLTVGAVVFAVHSTGDRPAGESHSEYWKGFAMMAGSAATFGLCLSLVEFSYAKTGGPSMDYAAVLEFDLVTNISATLFSTVGMAAEHNFQAIRGEATGYRSGRIKYYAAVFSVALVCQCLRLGIAGVIHYSSSLYSGILLSVLLPLVEVLAVVFFKDEYPPEKGIALFLSLWGFVSYFYGEYKVANNRN
ncbi:hypothetical protein M569_16026, partial [Genlisea aurea]